MYMYISKIKHLFVEENIILVYLCSIHTTKSKECNDLARVCSTCYCITGFLSEHDIYAIMQIKLKSHKYNSNNVYLW